MSRLKTGSDTTPGGYSGQAVSGEVGEGRTRLVEFRARALLVAAGVAALVGLVVSGCERITDPTGGFKRVSAGIDKLARDRDQLQAEVYRLREELRCLRPCVETCHGAVDGVACVRDCPPIGCPIAGAAR